MIPTVIHRHQVIYADTVSALVSIIKNSGQVPDFYSLDIERLYECKHTCVLNIVSMLQTLVLMSLSENNNVPKIILMVSDSTPAQMIKDINCISGIAFACKIGGKFTETEYNGCMAKITDNDLTLHPAIQAIIRPKKPCMRNGIQLTPRESQIFRLIQDRGASNKIIAKTLCISESTVKLHIGHLLKKYGVKNRTQLALFCHD